MNPTTWEHLVQFDIDPDAVGKILAQGTQHDIYAYQHDKVLKIPKLSTMHSVLGKVDPSTILQHLEILKSYIPEYVMNTQVLTTESGLYLILQELLSNASPFTYSRFPLVRDHIATIVDANRQIVQDHGLTLDFLGNSGYWGCVTAALSRRKTFAFSNNLLITQEANGRYRLCVVDINLGYTWLRTRGSTPLTFLHSVGDSVYYQVQRLLIWDIFGLAM
jgi:hypothetical protein